MEPQVWQVIVVGAVVGQVTLHQHGEELVVLDLGLTDQRHTAVLRSLLDCRAIADGATSVVLDVVGPGAAADVTAEGFETASVRMGLDLGPDLPGEEQVRLAPMGPEAFEAFRDELDHRHLHAHLPDDLQSPDQHLFTAWVGSTVVGHLWMAGLTSEEEVTFFVHAMDVVEEQRRRGHGAALVRAAALWARDQGASTVGLDVSGANTAARRLYAGLGWVVGGTTYRRVVGR